MYGKEYGCVPYKKRKREVINVVGGPQKP